MLKLPGPGYPGAPRGRTSCKAGDAEKGLRGSHVLRIARYSRKSRTG